MFAPLVNGVRADIDRQIDWARVEVHRQTRYTLMSVVNPRTCDRRSPPKTREKLFCGDRATVGASPETSVINLLFAGSRMSVLRLGLSRSVIGRRFCDRPQA